MASDPKILELLERLDEEELIEEAREFVEQDELITKEPEAAEEVLSLGIESEMLLSPEMLHRMTSFILVLWLALFAVRDVPEFQPYVEPVHQRLTDIAIVFHLLAERRRLAQERRGEE